MRGRLAVPLPDLPDTRSRRVYEFYVGAQQLFGIVSRKRVSRSLTRYAERELRRFLSDDSQVAVFALGKFGERELNYRSDLDVIAFYEGDYQAASVEVRKLVAACGEEFKIDLRLRPEGNKGSIVWDGEKTADLSPRSSRDMGEDGLDKSALRCREFNCSVPDRPSHRSIRV